MNTEEKIKFDHDKKQFMNELNNRNSDIEKCIQYCEEYDFDSFNSIKESIKTNRITKLFLIGMGSSLYASQYALAQLEHCNILTLSIEAAEFKNKYMHLVDEHTLLVIISQSGNSKEIVDSIEELKSRNCSFELITITNNLNGYLYTNYKNSILLNASKEFYISHNSYLNSLIVIKYLLEYLFDETHFSLKTDNELLIKLNDFDEELLKYKSSILTLFENIACVDFIYDINSKFNTINSTLLLREGIGLMTACYSKNEYLHGEHLVEIPNKLVCLIGVDDKEDKYNELIVLAGGEIVKDTYEQSQNRNYFLKERISDVQHKKLYSFMSKNMPISNAVTILAIEEPEAHLHPVNQRLIYKDVIQNSNNSVLLTTHSTHITAIAPINSIVHLHNDGTKGTEIHATAAMPMDEGEFLDVERYLDVKRGEIYLGKAVLLVEGIAEEYLVPRFAELLGKPLDEKGIIVCNINCTNFT
ncbi:SIS domain-containing protein, partial [uncultured Catenibacterium sp.]|uniref:SIS domain-containing protein n=1 Tax=uncultured Catenibacterium sp. TaxID=286142 RepID=UPI0025E2E67B